MRNMALASGSSTAYMRGGDRVGAGIRRKETTAEGKRLFEILEAHGPISEMELYSRFYTAYTYGQLRGILLSASVAEGSRIYEYRKGKSNYYAMLERV